MMLPLIFSTVGQVAFPPYPLQLLPTLQDDHSKPSSIIGLTRRFASFYGSFLEVTPYGRISSQKLIRFVIFVNAARWQKRVDFTGFSDLTAGRIAAVCCHI